MIRITCLFLLAIISATTIADDKRFLLIPDQFFIQEVFDQPKFSVRSLPGGSHQVKISYEVNMESLEKYLFQTYGKNLDLTTIYSAEALPVAVNHLSEIFSIGRLVTWRAIFQTNEVHLTYNFSSDYSKADINQLFKFSFLISTVDIEVKCEGQISSSLCDRTIKDIPLFNQFRIKEDESQRTLYNDLSQLTRYISYSRIGLPHLRLDTPHDVDGYLSSTLFNPGSQCLAGISFEKKNVCHLIQRYTKNRSILSAIDNIKSRLFNEFNLDTSREFFILDANEFSILGDCLHPDPNSVRSGLMLAYGETYDLYFRSGRKSRWGVYPEINCGRHLDNGSTIWGQAEEQFYRTVKCVGERVDIISSEKKELACHRWEVAAGRPKPEDDESDCPIVSDYTKRGIRYQIRKCDWLEAFGAP